CALPIWANKFLLRCSNILQMVTRCAMLAPTKILFRSINRGREMRFSKYTWAAAVVVAMAVTACGGGGGDDTTRVAKDDVAAPVTATTVKALSGPTFNFANGVPALGTTGP